MIICFVQTHSGLHLLNSVYKFSYGKLKFYLFFSYLLLLFSNHFASFSLVVSRVRMLRLYYFNFKK